MINAYSIVHYGIEYLYWSILNASYVVDKVYLIYAANSTHGTKTSVINPDKREDFIEIYKTLKNRIAIPIHWIETPDFRNEGYQRQHAEQLCSDAEITLVLDYDEIWDFKILKSAIDTIIKSNSHRYWGVRGIHLWKDFNHACESADKSTHFIYNKISEKSTKLLEDEFYFYHFGYCIRDSIMDYKWKIHGHINDLRPEWFSEKWYGDSLLDVHPTNKDFWNVKSFDKNRLPVNMMSHPRWK